MLNPFARLAPQQFQMPPAMNDYTQDQGVNPTSALAASSDATGADVGPQQSKLSGLSFPTPMLDRYQQTLNNPPNPANYEPSRMRKVLGAIAGFGAGGSPSGISDGQPVGYHFDPRMSALAHDQVTDEPYDRAMGKFSQLAKIQGEGAKVEEQNIANKRGIAVADARNEMQGREAAINQQKVDIARQKEHDIFTTKQQDLERKIADSESKMQFLQQEAQRKQGDFEAQLKVHQQTLELQRTLGELRHQQAMNQLDEQKRMHDAQITDMETKQKQAADRLKMQQEFQKERAAGKDISSYVTDAEGNIVGKKTTQVRPAGNTNQDKNDPLGIRK